MDIMDMGLPLYSVVSLKCHEGVFALYNLSNMSHLAVDAHLRTSH